MNKLKEKDLIELKQFLEEYFKYFPVPLSKLLNGFNRIIVLAYLIGEETEIVISGLNDSETILGKVLISKICSIKGSDEALNLFKSLSEDIFYQGYRFICENKKM